eukprot:Nitzschia sp. Nitz4//scaffold406_size10313//1957//3492//NITZ4_009074-RA/size10313-augustus-gene-0.10-mRNA-1//-1//CDS//3329551122//6620//frame0
MVEIETLPDEEPKVASADGWEKLMGDDLQLQVIDKSTPDGGKGPESINPQDTVLVDFVGRIAETRDDQDGPIFQTSKGCMLVVGEGDVLPCLEMAIRFMETGQTAKVWSHSKYAFGPGIRNYAPVDDKKKAAEGDKVQAQVPPNANVMYEIKVTMIVMDTSRLNPYFSIQKAISRKNIANDIYQHEWCPKPESNDDPTCETAMSRAIRLYTKAAKDMETLLQGTYFNSVEEDHPQRFQTRNVLIDCLNNIVAVQLRQQEYHKAKLSAIEVLKLDPNNLKGLMRAAKASLLDPASTMEEVHEALKAAESQITYRNPVEEKQLKQLKAQFKRKQQEYKKKSKEMFANKLHKASLSDEKEEEEDDKVESTTPESTTVEKANIPRKPSVQFDESTLKDSDKLENQKEGSANTTTARKTDDISFWKYELLKFLGQIVIPLALYFLYRMVSQAGIVGESTLAQNEARTPVVEEPELVETIDLDAL